jgi:hypothetical protein
MIRSNSGKQILLNFNRQSIGIEVVPAVKKVEAVQPKEETKLQGIRKSEAEPNRSQSNKMVKFKTEESKDEVKIVSD